MVLGVQLTPLSTIFGPLVKKLLVEALDTLKLPPFITIIDAVSTTTRPTFDPSPDPLAVIALLLITAMALLFKVIAPINELLPSSVTFN